MPLSSGKMLTSGVSGKCLTPPADAAGRRRLERRAARSSTRFSSNSTSWIVSRYDALRLNGIVHGERVERVAVARRVDLRFEDRQAGAAEEAADAREQVLLVRQVDEHLQAGVVARQPRPHDRLGAVDAEVEVARVPRDLVGACGAGSRRRRAATTASARRRRGPRTGAAAAAPRPAAACRLSASVGAPDAPASRARVAWNRSSSSFAFHAFHTFGLVPRMSATVSRYSAVSRRSVAPTLRRTRRRRPDR